MFKYFGLKEILFGFKKYLVIILVASVIFAVTGSFLLQIKDNSQNEEAPYNGDYMTSLSYLITSVNSSPDGSQKSIQADVDCANTLAAILNTNFCKEYVYNLLKADYSSSEILKYSGVTNSESELNHGILDDIILIEVTADTSILNIHATSSNIDFSNSVAGGYVHYLENIGKAAVHNIKTCTALGETTTMVDNTTTFSRESQIISLIKNVLIFGIIGFIIMICVVMLLTLFNPCVASQASFENYGLKVFTNTNKKASTKYLFITDAIVNLINNKDIQSIAVVSSINSNKIKTAKSYFFEKLESAIKDIDKTKLINIESVSNDFSDFKSAVNCDAILFIEKVGLSNHKELANVLSLFSNYDTDILGVVLV